MPTVDTHIATLLQEHDCVIIPGFGGLITQYSPVRIHPVRHAMAPPSKKVAFNEKLQLNDGRLVNHISIREQLSETDAATRVEAFVAAVNLALNQYQRYQLQDIGLFRKEAGRPIEFEYEEKINLLAESFGLPEVFSKPVLRNRSLAEIRTVVQEKVAIPLHAELQGPENISLWKKTLRYAALLPIVLLSASAIYLASTLQNDFSLGSLNPVELVRGTAVKPEIPVTMPGQSSSVIKVPLAKITEEQQNELYLALVPQNSEPAAYLTDQFLSQEITAPQPEAETLQPEETIVSEPATTVNKAAEPKKVAAKAENAVPAVIKPVKENATTITIKEKTGRYYIIAGGFTNEENATRLQKKIAANGLDSKIILPGKESRLNRVTVGEFETLEQANKKLPELTPTYGRALWILEY